MIGMIPIEHRSPTQIEEHLHLVKEMHRWVLDGLF